MQELYKKRSKQRHHLDDLLYDEVSNIDSDQDYWFKLRASESNLLICAATPLLGLSLRIRKLMHCENVENIYSQAVEEIKNIEVELAENHFDHAIILAYRYVLCSVIDEAVMSTAWGADSCWAENSLLTHFHNETWGGEKVFSILDKLKNEPERYHQLLAFIFLCLSLGFEGRYKVIEKGSLEHKKILSELFGILSDIEREHPMHFDAALENVVCKKHEMKWRLTPKTIMLSFFTFIFFTYVSYQYLINKSVDNTLKQLSTLL
ncbi:type IVB secretion system protein IcmH/DotU [Enterovibrio coralii]|uniref:Type IV secretion protein DotU n=1 Tax=Enterovibrio coralii TaxID=294935 RepID=A0A135IC69_9GAMM|nr:type IVB secretion system protein IcmH/DotU [Enterovibrio coralii]KXF83062.1 type IV secretion protein DotU [Enterovibrio coralii]